KRDIVHPDDKKKSSLRYNIQKCHATLIITIIPTPGAAMKYPLTHALLLICLSSLLIACGGGSGGDNNNKQKIYGTLNIKVVGLDSTIHNGSGLELKLPDGSSKTLGENSTFQYSNAGKETQSNKVEIVTQPQGQACILARDPNDDSSGSTLNIGVYCGAANTITVTGIDGRLPSSSPLVITRDLSYYQNRNLTVSAFALMSIIENSTA